MFPRAEIITMYEMNLVYFLSNYNNKMCEDKAFWQVLAATRGFTRGLSDTTQYNYYFNGE